MAKSRKHRVRAKKSRGRAVTRAAAVAERATERATEQPQTISPVLSVKLRRGKAQKKLELLAGARTFFRKRKIHPKRIVPKVPQGEFRADTRPTPRLALYAPRAMELAVAGRGAAAVMAASDTLEFVRNVQLGSVADNDTSSNVCEPSVAAKGDVVFYTGNWFAALSTDGGATFSFVDPYTAFPDPPGMGFCCDQVVNYIPQIDMFVWMLQYTENADGANIQRLAFAKTADVATGNWQFWDIVPDDIGVPGEFLDYPDLAVGSNMLYVSTNSFAGNSWTRSILLRIPVSSIESGSVTADYVSSSANFNFRPAQSCGTTGYWASHEDTSTLRVFSWKESANVVNFDDVPVASWDDSDFDSITPDNFNWLGRADRRLVGGAMAGKELWFSWTAARGGANNRPHPYVQIAQIRSTDMKLIKNINLWDPDSAIAYAALGSNSNDEVAASYAIGGGPRFPSAVVAILTGTRRDVVAGPGSRGPKDNRWGDYLAVRRHYPDQKLFNATGYSLLPTSDGIKDATPRFMRFGRAADVGP